MEEGTSRAGYGVKLVRGPFLRLDPHPRHVESAASLIELCGELRAEQPGLRLAADLFSGAGGLSLGLQQAGVEVVFSVDHDNEAVETHRHHFPGMSVDWDLADASVVEETAEVIRAAGIDILVGGPPCQPFSKAGRSGIRHRVRHGLRDPHDQRRDLWRSFVEIVRLAGPQAVVMENVPDMALDSEMFILRSMVEELEQLNYSVEERVVETWRYGVPQFRQRLILVALADRAAFDWPAESPDKVTVWNAIGDLPEVRGGWRPEGGAQGFTDYAGPQNAFQSRMRSGVPDTHQGRVYDHITRPVREDDARAFELMDTNTRYSQLPDDVKRYRDDIFDDKYKRLDGDDLSRTITAHISKDGYWYIHPREGRTITVREAARLQTFPDRYRFAGPPSAAFRQIGNAVPPALGFALAGAVTAALDDRRSRPYLTRDLAAALARWFEERDVLRIPWLRAATRWQLVTAAVLLDRSTPEQVRHVWPVLRMWREPADVLSNADLFRRIGQLTGRTKRTEKLLELAAAVSEEPEVLDDDSSMLAVAGLTRPVAELAVLAVPVGSEDENEEPVGAGMGVLRVAARFTGTPVDTRNKLTDGRLAVARLIGGGQTSRSAQLGLIELAATLCRPVDPVCPECPLQAWCRSASTVDDLISLSEGRAYPDRNTPPTARGRASDA